MESQADAASILDGLGGDQTSLAQTSEGRRYRMMDRRSLMRILAGAALLNVENRATAQKAKSFTIAYLALLPGEDRTNFVAAFLHRLNELCYVDGQILRLL